MDLPERLCRYFRMDVPSHDPLMVTGAALRVFPDLTGKVDVLRSAFDLAHTLGFPVVRVAILAADAPPESEGRTWEDELKPREFRIRVDVGASPGDVAAFLSWKS